MGKKRPRSVWRSYDFFTGRQLVVYAYCLFCQTQKCGLIASVLEMRGVDRAFAPQIIRRQRRQGVNEDRVFDLLPGYVFVYSEKELAGYDYLQLVEGISGIARRIGDREHNWALTGGDREFAMNLYRKNGVVGQFTIFRTGEKVRLTDPLFNGCQGTVTRMDMKKQRARVDYEFAGMHCFTWVACEVIEKLEENAPEADQGESIPE